MKTGDKVEVQCPGYRGGKKFEGVVTGVNFLNAKVKVKGNIKSTAFHFRWLSAKN